MLSSHQRLGLPSNLYSTPNIINDEIKEDEMGGACRTHEIRNAYKTLVENLEEKDGMIVIDLKETGYENVRWIHLAQDRDQ
jgi:hypothetical protein